MTTMKPSDPRHTDYLISTGGLRAEIVEPTSDNMLLGSTISNLLEELESHYLERCGFITKEEEIFPVFNSHDDPHNNFYMDEEDATNSIWYILEELDDQIMGIYHTHPNGYPWPSPRDIVGWPNPELNWRYFLVSRGHVTEWRLVRD